MMTTSKIINEQGNLSCFDKNLEELEYENQKN